MYFPGKIFFCFHFRFFFQAKWCSLKQFSFIYFLISWTTRSICGISQIKNAMIPITKIPVMTVARVSFVINYFQTWFENHLDTDYLSITSLLNQWINPAPVKLDLEPNQAELIKFQLSKNDSMKVYGFLLSMNYVDSQQYQVFMFTTDHLQRNFSWLNLQEIKTVLNINTWN